MRDSDLKLEDQKVERGGRARRRYLPLAFLLLMTSVLLLTMMLAAYAASEKVGPSNSSAASLNSKAAFAVVPEAFALKPQDYSKFSHTSPGAHADFSNPSNCDSCHQRNGATAQPAFPGHKACINCHLAQFTTTNIPMCTICHINDLGNPNPALKGFPPLRSFRVSFDHQEHVNVGANCASCHKPARRGAALTIPASLNAHAQCYACHSPGLSASSLSSCGTCHSIGGYNRTPATGRAFSFSFSHATHGPRQRLGCADCHIVRAGLPQSRQVSSPAAFQHFARSRAQSCMTCHNGRRAFGEADFGDCKKCHKGATFRMGT